MRNKGTFFVTGKRGDFYPRRSLKLANLTRVLAPFRWQWTPFHLPAASILVVLWGLAILMLLVPLPLCACWLVPQAEPFQPYHVHFSHEHAESEHSHGYLFQMFPTTHPELAPLVLTPVQVWIALAWMGSVWWRVAGHPLGGEGWLPAIPLPPPEKLAYL
ncbi:MAG: hypothetical protein HUU38_16510 [Anaerolineales bacterium]|nr:hypothetical protein [Anaerolineales bacterium]